MTSETPETPKRGPGRPRKAVSDEAKLQAMAASLEIGDVLPGDIDDDVAFESVRQQARHDPPINCPMRLVAENGEDCHIEPGDWYKEGWLVDPDTQLPRNMPVEALGVDSAGTSYYYFNTLGHMVELKGDAGKGIFELLFAGRNDYLFWLFPRWNKKHTSVVGWEADHLKQALTKVAGWRETFDPENGVRGRGIWLDGKGRAIVHAGNAVWYDGEWKKPGRHGGIVYPARMATGRPRSWDEYPTPGPALLGILETFIWERPQLDPKLKLGWIVTAKMGGALFRRPYIWVSGPKGSGKSYLQTLSRASMHGALFASSSATTAAIYQRLGKDSIPVLIDEQESQADPTIADRLLQLMRAAYSGDTIDKGDKGGKAKSYMLYSSFMASSIAKPAMESSDESRMALLSLRKRPEGSPKVKVYDEGEVYRMGQALSRRIVDWLPKWPALLAGIEAALDGRKGHEIRSLDTFGPLIAGYHLAMYDAMPTAEQYAEYALLLDPAGLKELREQTEDWERCLRHILGAHPETMRNATRKTIGEVISDFARSGVKGLLQGIPPADFDTDQALAGMRVCVTYPRKDGDGKRVAETIDNALLFIPNTDPAMVELLKGSPWVGKAASRGPWDGVLQQAPRELWVRMSSSRRGPSVWGVGFRIVDTLRFLARGEEGDDDGVPPAPAPMKPAPQGALDLDVLEVGLAYEDFSNGGDGDE